MARRVLLGIVLVLASSAFGADHPTNASCATSLPAGAVELGASGRSDKTILLRFEGIGVVAPDLEAFQLLARCASRSNGDLTLRASAPVDAELFTQAVQRIAELVRLAVAEGQPNARMSVEINTRADRQPIIEVQVSLTVPRAPEVIAVAAPTQLDPSKDPRIAWDRAQRYEERLAAVREKEKLAREAMSAREAAAEEARAEREEREARARFDARERTRALAEQARRSEQERRAAQAAATLAEEKRKALDQQLALRDERLKKGREERKAREERARADEEAVAKARAADRAARAARVEEVAKSDGAWVQPVARRDLVGVERYEPRGEEQRGEPEKMVRPQRDETVKVAKVEPTPQPEGPVEREESPKSAEERLALEESSKTAEAAGTPAAAESTKTAEVEPAETKTEEPRLVVARVEATRTRRMDAAGARGESPKVPTKAAEVEPAAAKTEEPTLVVARLEATRTWRMDAVRGESPKVPRAEPARSEPTTTVEATPAVKPARSEPTTTVKATPAEKPAPAEPTKPVAEPAPVAEEPTRVAALTTSGEKRSSPLPDPLPPRGDEGDKAVDSALEPLKLAMKAYDEEMRLQARKDAEVERAVAARKAALEERQAALAEKATRLNAGKLPTVGAEEKELARLEKERLAEEKKAQAAAAALAEKERKQAAEEARLAERARKLKERELAGRDEKSVDAARVARLELEAAAERSRKEQEALALERLKADEQALAAREARLTALSKRVELATVKSETLLPGDAGRKQITNALSLTTKDIQRCVDAQLKRFPVAGKTQAVLALTIDLRGRVSASSISAGPLKGSYLESCLHEASRAWRFPSSDSELELEVPLTLVGH